MRYFMWLALFFFVSQSQAESSPKPTIKVCGNPAYPPISWMENGHIIGVAPSIVTRIVSPLGYHVSTQQDSNWRRCLKEAENGHIDVVVAAYKNQARKGFLQYLDAPLIIEPIMLYYNRAAPLKSIKWQDLKGLTVGILSGDSFGDEVDKKLRQYTHIEFVSTSLQNIQKLQKRRIDFMPLGEIGGQLQLNKEGYNQAITSLPTPIVSDYWFIGISKRSPLMQHLTELNRNLNVLKKQHAVEDEMASYIARYMAQPAQQDSSNTTQ